MTDSERILKLRQGYHLMNDCMSVAEDERWTADDIVQYVETICEYILDYDNRHAT